MPAAAKCPLTAQVGVCLLPAVGVENGGHMSIKKIAQMTGASVSTVSRVLNNPDYKCQDSKLRDRIWKAAVEINYVPNEAARSLKKGGNADRPKNYYINILLTRSDSSHSDPFFDELLRVIESEIHKNSCILSRVWYNSTFSDDRRAAREKADRLADEMYEQTGERCDGLIIIGRCSKDALKKLKAAFKNVVSVNRNSTNYEVDEVLCDGRKIASMAIEHLLKLGHSNIAYVGNIRNEARFEGYMEAMRKHDIEVLPELIFDTDQTESHGYEVMENVLKSEERPTAFYCANDITAVGMIKCLNRYRNRYYVPSIIASDNIYESRYTKPMLTTINLPREEMGRFTVELLVDRIRGRHQNVMRLEIEGNLVVRDSCAPVDETYITEYCI